MSDLVDRLRRNSGWRDERFQCVTDPALLAEAANRIEELERQLAEAVLAEREACAKVAEDERVDYAATEDPTDLSYNIACEHIAAAIRERTDGR